MNDVEIELASRTHLFVHRDVGIASRPSPKARQLVEQAIAIGQGRFQLTIPEVWKRQEPRSTMIAHEFAFESGDAQLRNGRITMMNAGGSVEANLERWEGQFEGGTAERQSFEIAGTRVHTLSLKGTYQDRPRGPFGPSVAQANYRMLAAIIETPGQGSFFVTKGEPSFQQCLKSLKRAAN